MMNSGFETAFFVLSVSVAYAQVFVLPGVILLRSFNLKLSVIQYVVFCFASSLIVNHFLVYALAGFNLFVYHVVIFIVFFEFLWIAGKFYKDRSNKKSQKETREVIIEKKQEKQILLIRLAYIFSWLACAATLMMFIWIFLKNIGTDYILVDDRTSWYFWALDFLANNINGGWGYYPQLIPAKSAMVYLLAGSTAQYLTKQYMALFSIFMLLTQLDLAFKLKKIALYWGMIITGLLVFKIAWPYIPSGYVDLPVAFFSFLSIYCLLVKPQDKRIVLLGAFFAVGASLTKQAGLFVLVVFPLLFYVLSLRTIQKKRQRLFLLCVLILSLASPYYVYKKIRVERGMANSNIKYLTTEIHKNKLICEGCGESPCKRCNERLSLFYGKSQLRAKLGLIYDISLFGFLSLVLLSILSPIYRWVLLFIPIPYFLIWCLFFSYDIRNVFLSFPFLGLAAGFGMDRVLCFFKSILPASLLKSTD
jgi:hypothetical protein